MQRFLKPIQALLFFAVIAALTGCTLGQAAEPTPTAVDVNAVMTAAAADAYAQLTQTAEAAPTATSTQTSAPTQTIAPTNQPQPLETIAPSPTVQPLSVQITDTPVVVLETTPTVAGVATFPVDTGLATSTPVRVSGGATAAPGCRSSSFVEDVTIPDGTQLQRGEKFTKIWRIQNNGFCSWDEGFGIVSWNGPSLSGENDYFSAGEKVEPGGVVDMVMHMRAPDAPGEYISHWVMVDDAGKPFGTDLVVYIIVK